MGVRATPLDPLTPDASQCLGGGLSSLPEQLVQAHHEIPRRSVAHPPCGHDHLGHTGEVQTSSQTEDSFTEDLASAGGLTTGEHHEATVERTRAQLDG